MTRKVNWHVEEVADDAALMLRMSELRLAGRGVQNIVKGETGQGYIITYLAHVYHFSVSAEITTDMSSAMGRAPMVAPWSVANTLEFDHLSAELMSVAIFPNNTFAVAYTAGWERAPGTPYSENAFNATPGPLYMQFGDHNGLPLGGVVPHIKELGQSTWQPDTDSLPGGEGGSVIVCWEDYSDMTVKFTIVNSKGVTVHHPHNLGYTQGLSYAPRVIALQGGGFMILYSELSSSHLQVVVFDAAGLEINRPSLLTSVAFDGDQFDCALNASGEVVMAYTIPYSENFGYCVFNADGTLKEDIGAISANGGQQMPNVAVLDNGNYFFSWYDGYTEHDGVYAIYNELNVLQKAEATLGTDLKLPHCVARLDNGGAAVLTTPNGINSDWRISFYDSAGVFEQTLPLGSAGIFSPGIVGPSAIQLSHGLLVAISPHFQHLGKVSILQGS
jgi:hypothetical protein